MFTVQFRKLASLIRLKGFRFHDLRNAFASITAHSSLTVTLSILIE